MGSIFLSHNSKDKAFVRRLADDLRKNGHYAWVDEAEIKVGDSLIEKIEEGIENTQYLGVVISSNSIESKWVTREVEIALNQEINEKKVKVLPILIEKVKIPAFLLDKKYADFTSEDNYEDSLQLIIDRLSELPDNMESTSYDKEELDLYEQLMERMKEELNITKEENQRLIRRLEKERNNIPADLKTAIVSENERHPEFADINNLYAFEVSGCTITAGYVLHGLRKEYMKGGPHVIALLCDIENKNDELALLLGATIRRVQAIREKDN